MQGENAGRERPRLVAEDRNHVTSASLWRSRRNVSPTDTTRIGVLVVEIRDETEACAFANSVPDELEPARRQILRDESGPRVQERSAKS
jgi:hypothetical protein